MGHTANSHSQGSEKKYIGCVQGRKSFKETKTRKTENTEHHKVTMIGVFVQYETASLLLRLSRV